MVSIGVDLLRKKLNLNTEQQKKEQAEKQELNKQNIEDVVNAIEESKLPNKYPDFVHYQGLKKIILATSTESWVMEEGKKIQVQGRTYKRFIRVNGNIENAYLFIDISVDHGRPLKVWDSIYVSLRKMVGGYLYQPIDGHLLRSKSLNVPEADNTQLLYDLRQIPLTTIPYSNDNKFNNKNWLILIQQADKFQFETFLSTFRKGGEIRNISIGYECMEDTPNCNLEIVNE